MPKKVDHHARRTQIADALMRVAASRGLDAVSLRHVAAEAGVSAGMVQHYFRTKDEMMTFALAVVAENVRARMEADGPGPDAPARAVLRELLTQLLPLDETRRTEAHVALAFHAYAAVKPDVAAELRRDGAEMRAFVAALLPEDAEPDRAAATLLALVEGLSLHVLVGQCTPEEAFAAFEAQLDAAVGEKSAPDSVGGRL